MSRILSGKTPKIALPKGSIDSHCHVYHKDYPAQPGGPDVPPDAPSLREYRQLQAWLGLEKVVFTQPNAYQADNTCLLEALNIVGDDNARGVVVVTSDTTEEQLQTWHDLGVRGARIMQLPMGAVKLELLKTIADKIKAFGWSCIVQFNGQEILQHAPILNNINNNYVIDHHGKFLPPVKINSPQFQQLLKLIDKGNCYYKVAACYESSQMGHPLYEDIATMTRHIIKYAPERIIWGSNWPHVSTTAELAPNDASLLDTVMRWMPDETIRQRIFVDNPLALYWDK
ncbi:amidohydrolase family protein [Marinomonas sp.]